MSRGHTEPERSSVQSSRAFPPNPHDELFDGAALSRPKLFIVSDIRLLCDGLALALSQQNAVNVLGFADLSVPLGRLAELDADILLLDIGSSGALSVCRHVHQALPRLKILAISVVEIGQDVIPFAEAGISGFVTRQGTAQDVITAVHSAMRGELVCSPRMTALLLKSLASLSNKSSGIDIAALTGREYEIAALVSEGLSNKEIARALRIQNATVKNHVHNILGKLRVRRRGEAAAQLRKIHPQGLATFPSGL